MARKRRTPGNRSNGRGTLLIERRFPQPVGEIRLASGTNDSQALKDIHTMLDALARGVPPRYDVLLAIKSRAISPMFALSLWRQNSLHELPRAEVLPLLRPTMEEWIEQASVSPEYRASMRTTLNALLRHGTEPTLRELPALLQSYRNECKAEGKPVQFNRAKAHCQAFVRDTLRKRHELYSDVSDVDPLAVEGETLRRPQRPDKLAEILARLPQPHRDSAWNMAVSGMGPKEYWGEWERREIPPHLHIVGTKRASRIRDVPLWTVPFDLPQRSRSAFEGMWDRHIGELLGIYDLRRSFAVWLGEAGIPPWRHPLYMGHSARSQTAQYQRTELLAWLEEDGDRLYSYAGLVVQAARGERATLDVA